MDDTKNNCVYIFEKCHESHHPTPGYHLTPIPSNPCEERPLFSKKQFDIINIIIIDIEHKEWKIYNWSSASQSFSSLYIFLTFP